MWRRQAATSYNSGALWKNVKLLNIINRKKSVALPAHLNDIEGMSVYFADTLINHLPDINTLDHCNNHRLCNANFSFTLPLVTDNNTIISSFKSNACGTDNINMKMI